MPEPHSTTTAGIAIGAGIGLTGTVMGAQIDALLIGLVAAICQPNYGLPGCYSGGGGE